MIPETNTNQQFKNCMHEKMLCISQILYIYNFCNKSVYNNKNVYVSTLFMLCGSQASELYHLWLLH